MFLATLMIALGIAILAFTLIAFSNPGSEFTFKAKEVATTTTEAATTEKPETKVEKTETDYADTVVIFALTIGAALMLAGGFYGRLRSLKLGGLEIGLVGDEEKEKVAKEAAAKVGEKIDDPEKKKAAEVAVGPVAQAELGRFAAAGILPTEQVIALASSQAADKVARAVQ
jgi:preprotein translocase subunit YajC